MVPTDVVAINIEVITIHYPLNIPTDCFEKCLPPLTQKIKSSLRNRLSDMKIIIINEISMVSNNLFCVYIKLNEIFDLEFINHFQL